MRRCVALYGCTCIIAQILLLREILVAFHGNELSYGITLASWLFLMATATWLAGKLTKRFRLGISSFALTLAGSGILVPLTILLVRWAQHSLPGGRGEAFPPITMVCIMVAILTPLCFTLGSFFAVACEISARSSKLPAQAASRVYLFESVGAFAGGILFTYVLIQSFDALLIALGAGLANCAAAFTVWWNGNRRERLWGWLLLSPIILFIVCLASPAGTIIDFASQALRFPEQALRVSIDTRHGHIDVAETRVKTSFYESGALVGTNRMEISSEERAYLALLAHPEPNRALIIGGSLTGVLQKALECSGLMVDCVEMDPAIVNAGYRYAHTLDHAALASSRARIFTQMDARMFIKSTPLKYDVIVSALPNPSTGLINRFYTADFFAEAKAALSDQGVLLIAVNGGPSSMSPAHHALVSIIHDTLCSVFEEVNALPADDAIYYLASPQLNPGFPHTDMWPSRLTSMGIEPKWLTPNVLAKITNAHDIAILKSNIAKGKRLSVNTDLRPVAHYHALQLWLETMAPRAQKLIRSVFALDIASVLLAIAILTGALCLAATFAPKPLMIGVPAACAYAGASGFTLQMVLLFTFQGLYGNVYGQLGVIFAAFMAGTTFGAAIARRLDAARSGLKMLMLLQVAVAVLAALIVPLLSLLGTIGPRTSALAAIVLIPLINMCVGTLVGMQFPIGIAVYAPKESTSGKTALLVRLYAMDLAGACVGALVGTTVIIPTLGLHRTCWMVSTLSLASLPLLLLSERRRA